MNRLMNSSVRLDGTTAIMEITVATDSADFHKYFRRIKNKTSAGLTGTCTQRELSDGIARAFNTISLSYTGLFLRTKSQHLYCDVL